MCDKRSIQTTLVVVLSLTARVGADLLVDHQPLNSGGPSSDTDFVSMFGEPSYWQLVADDFTLSFSAATRHVVWWGLYGGDFGGSSWYPPTVPETMRLRFYSARPSDGLPGDILREENFLNSSRVWTGRYVTGHPEYRFEADLAEPFSIAAGATYWLDAAQVGVPDSVFRWEYSLERFSNGPSALVH